MDRLFVIVHKSGSTKNASAIITLPKVYGVKAGNVFLISTDKNGVITLIPAEVVARWGR